jgi:3-dehydroquinate dehydratase-2
MSQQTVVVLNGPNLNLLGEREPEIYGSDTLSEIEALCRKAAGLAGLEVDFRQSNHEGALVDAIHEVRKTAVGIVINAGAYTHTSIAVRDALAAVSIPVFEVHLTNVHKREEFRHHSYLSAVSDGVIIGCGPSGYAYAIARISELIGDRT